MITYEIMKRNNRKTGVKKLEWEKKDIKLNINNDFKISLAKQTSQPEFGRSLKDAQVIISPRYFFNFDIQFDSIHLF